MKKKVECTKKPEQIKKLITRMYESRPSNSISGQMNFFL